MKNIFIRLLEELSVPYTMEYADELYATHPNRDNMLGLCQMCEAYGIAAKGVKVMDKNFDVLSIPSVLHVSGRFVILTDMTCEEVTYDWNGQVVTQSKSDFVPSWDGQALLVESDKGAIEPLFSEHRKQVFSNYVQSLMFGCLTLLCLGFMFFQTLCKQNALSVFFALTDVLGIGTCYLLLQKQTFQSSSITDKACSMFHQKDCNDLLHSDKAKIYGYSWSEIGLGYFVAHFLIAWLLPSAVLLLSVVNWCAMCYGIWSVYYQARIARQWCMLCMLVQILLWTNGIASVILLNDILLISELCVFLSVRDGVYFFSVAVAMIVVTHQIASSVVLRKTLRDRTYQYRSLKCNVEVFRHLLHLSKYVPTDIGDSTIVFGNEKAKLRITVLANPHCTPCAAKHKQVDELIDRYGRQLSVQYIFWAFSAKHKQSNRFLIAIFQQLDDVKAREVYRKWYESGKNQSDSFMSKYPDIDCCTITVEQEMQNHTSWIARSGFSATPIILVNGYVLPSEYDLMDLPLFTDVQL